VIDRGPLCRRTYRLHTVAGVVQFLSRLRSSNRLGDSARPVFAP
jgi:hypothetical protein